MKLAALPLAIFLSLAPLGAEQQTPVFRTGANIVTLDATVVDKDGKPVRGLKADDFVVAFGAKR